MKVYLPTQITTYCSSLPAYQTLPEEFFPERTGELKSQEKKTGKPNST